MWAPLNVTLRVLWNVSDNGCTGCVWCGAWSRWVMNRGRAGVKAVTLNQERSWGCQIRMSKSRSTWIHFLKKTVGSIRSLLPNSLIINPQQTLFVVSLSFAVKSATQAKSQINLNFLVFESHPDTSRFITPPAVAPVYLFVVGPSFTVNSHTFAHILDIKITIKLFKQWINKIYNIIIVYYYYYHTTIIMYCFSSTVWQLSLLSLLIEV